MHEHVGLTRVAMKNGLNYCVTEDIDAIMLAFEQSQETVLLTSVTGQAAFPPERLFLRCSDIASLQEVSAESWIWMQRAHELHYARQIEETTAQDRMAAAFERFTGEDDDE